MQEDLVIHSHEFSELVIVTRGRGVHFTEAGCHPVEAGDVFVVPPGFGHGYRETRDLGLINVLFNFDRMNIPLVDLVGSPGFHALFRLEPHYRRKQALQSHFKLDPSQLEEVSTLIAVIEQQKQNAPPGCEFLCLALFMQLVGFLSQCYGCMASKASRELIDAGAVFSHIQSHFDRAISIAELCRIAHLSESSLLRLFRETVGVSPHDYLLTIRINHACNLLAGTPEKITDIALKTGFNDSNYFARLFKKRTGFSPASYRARILTLMRKA